MESKIVISEVVKTSWGYLKSQIWVLVGLFTGYLIINGILTGMSVSFQGTGIRLLIQLISLIVSICFTLGYYKNIFQVMDGVEPQFSAYGQQAGKILTAFVASLLMGIAIAIGTILLIIPGIYLALRLQFAIQVIVEENAGITESLKRSWDITRGHVMELFLLCLVYILIVLAGIIVLGVGTLVAIPLIWIINCYVYRILVQSPVVTPLSE